jgi:hypothetical protein
MRHAQISTTMNVYGNALMEAKREANTKVVRKGTEERIAMQRTLQAHQKNPGVFGGAWGYLGLVQSAKWVAGVGFEPSACSYTSSTWRTNCENVFDCGMISLVYIKGVWPCGLSLTSRKRI